MSVKIYSNKLHKESERRLQLELQEAGIYGILEEVKPRRPFVPRLRIKRKARNIKE